MILNINIDIFGSLVRSWNAMEECGADS
ncbi:uncharacterized protein METZ01_LOCUS192469 [marine metagenome]|uniref:Uncharacterized protein n=1 Tax=marine metagenome TaxID=408172 RepID=A0A382DN24_9ZZZZ